MITAHPLFGLNLPDVKFNDFEATEKEIKSIDGEWYSVMKFSETFLIPKQYIFCEASTNLCDFDKRVFVKKYWIFETK